MRKLARIAFIGLLPIGCMGSGGVDDSIMSFTIAGAGTSGTTDGPGPSARFNNPVNCFLGVDGTLYVCDFDNDRVRAIGTDSVVRTLVNQAGFARPFGIAFAGGELFVQTDANDAGARDGTTGTVWRVDLATGAATVVVRNIGRPRGMVGLPDGRLALTNLTRHIVQVLDPDTAGLTTLAGMDGMAGFADATGAAAMFNRPYGIARRSDGTLVVADESNNRIRVVTLTGEVSTLAGLGPAGYVNGPRLQACFNKPQDVETDPFGNVFVGDNGNHRFRVIAGETVSLLAGDGIAGFKDSSLTQSRFFGMEGFAISSDYEYLYVADGTGGDDVQPFHRVRKLCIR